MFLHDSEGLFTKQNPKNWGFKIRIPYLGGNNSPNPVFEYFFIYKILVHQSKISKNPRNPKKTENPKKSEKSGKI